MSETTSKDTTKVRKYRILSGIHNEGGPIYRGANRDVFESSCDLLSLNSPGSRRFELVDEEEEVAERSSNSSTKSEFTRTELSQFTVKDLRELAEEQEIDLGEATKKEDIISVLLGE